MKSSMAVGPRKPSLSERWLAPTVTPWVGVSSWPPESLRTRSRSPPVDCSLVGGLPEPVLSVPWASVLALAVATGVSGLMAAPEKGQRDSSPYSLGLVGLEVICADRSPDDMTFLSSSAGVGLSFASTG